MLWRLLAFATLVVGGGVVPSAPAASAQGGLIQATPPPGAVLATAPARIDLLFGEEIDEERSSVRLFNAAGERVDRRDLQVAEKSMNVGVRILPDGVYTVRWTAASAEGGHAARGEHAFRVGAPRDGQPQLALTPARTDAGQLVTVTGSGFTPGSLVVVGIGDEQRFLGTARVDGTGSFALETGVPDYLPHGRQVVQALDLEQRMATGELRIERGGWPPVAVVVQVGEEGGHGHAHGPASEHEAHVAVQVRLVNRSGWDLFDVSVTGTIPAGTRLVRGEVEGPDGVRWSADGGQVRWRNARVRPHQFVGPFVYVLDTSGLPAGAALPEPSVTVTFEHRESPQFRGQATAP
jgi:methionine-rich copper-binding protein CopC